MTVCPPWLPAVAPSISRVCGQHRSPRSCGGKILPKPADARPPGPAADPARTGTPLPWNQSERGVWSVSTSGSRIRRREPFPRVPSAGAAVRRSSSAARPRPQLLRALGATFVKDPPLIVTSGRGGDRQRPVGGFAARARLGWLPLRQAASARSLSGSSPPPPGESAHLPAQASLAGAVEGADGVHPVEELDAQALRCRRGYTQDGAREGALPLPSTISTAHSP